MKIFAKLLDFFEIACSPKLFSPTCKYFYTDISVISVTFCNSAPMVDTRSKLTISLIHNLSEFARFFPYLPWFPSESLTHSELVLTLLLWRKWRRSAKWRRWKRRILINKMKKLKKMKRMKSYLVTKVREVNLVKKVKPLLSVSPKVPSSKVGIELLKQLENFFFLKTKWWPPLSAFHFYEIRIVTSVPGNFLFMER